MTELVAEVGLAHEGSLGIAHSYIDICSAIGIDTIKFQMHISEAESSLKEQFRIPFSYADKNRYSYWERTSFNFSEWLMLKKHCDFKNINFLVSAFSIEALEQIKKLGCKRIKLGSAETIDPLIVNEASRRSFDMILSNGFAGDNIFNIISGIKINNKLTILECISEYPSSIKDFNLKRFSNLKEIKDINVGLSDHSSSTHLSKYLISIGVDMIEAHIVFNKSMFGPDSSSSLEINQWEDLISFRNDIESIEPDIKKLANKEIKQVFSRSLTYRRDIKKGEKISSTDFESTKYNGEGISTNKYRNFINKILAKTVKKRNLVKNSDFEVTE